MASWGAGAVAVLLACEVLLQFLPVSTSTNVGYHLDALILTYPPNHAWTSSSGWDLRDVQHQRSNNAGFLADHDFARNPDAVALIGDSFVEAAMLPAADRPGRQLEALLRDRPVFAMGGPGSALLDYAERIRFAAEHYSVRDFVILMERFDVRQSLCGSGNIHGPCLDRRTLLPRTETQAPPDLLKRIVRNSALAQYLFSQLRLRFDGLWQRALLQSRPVLPPAHAKGPMEARPTSRSESLGSAIDAVTDAFFSRIDGRVAGRLVIVVDSDRSAINRGDPIVDPDRARFIELARARGAQVIDSEPLYREHIARSVLRLEVSPTDSHLNRAGIAIVMQAAARVLQTP